MEPRHRPLTGRTGRWAEPALLALPVVVLLLLGFVIPVGRLVVSSLSADGAFSLHHYSRFFESDYHLAALARSFRLGLIQTVAVLVVAIPLAYLMARCSRRLRAILLIATILPLMTSVVVRTFGWVVLVGPAGPLAKIPGFMDLSAAGQGLLGTELGIHVAMVQVLIPFAVLAILGVVSGIDPKLEEASRTMGAGFLRTIRHVVLPLIAPGIVAGATLVLAVSVSSFITPSLMGGPQIPVGAALIYQEATVTLDWPFAAAQAVLLLTVVLVTVGVTARYARSR